MRLPKILGLSLLALLGANLLSWALIGRGSAITLAAPQFYSHFGPYTDLDTLYVYDRYTGADNDAVSTPGDFASRDRDDFLMQLRKSSGVREVIYRDFEGDPFSEAANFGAWIDRKYPLAARVTSTVTSLGFAADLSQWYVWAFGWWPVGPFDSGIS